MSAESLHPSDALLPLVYGELSQEEARSVQAHVEGCSACASTVASYQAVRQAAAALPREVPGAPGLEALLVAGAEAATRAGRRRRRARMSGAFLGGAAALAVLVVVVMRSLPAPERPSASAPAPGASSVGPLAVNDVQRAKKLQGELEEKQEPARAPARERVSAGAVAHSSRLSAAKAMPPSSFASDAKGAADVPAKTAEPAGPKVAAAEPGPTSPPQLALSAPMAKRAVAAQAPAGAASGAMAQRKAPADMAPAPAAEDRLESTAVGRDARLALDAGSATERHRDEARREVLRSRLAAASLVEALPLLSELCALEVRLSHRADAARACAKVVEDYPGTSEADTAQRQLDVLRTP